jgi:hypothetical protein
MILRLRAIEPGKQRQPSVAAGHEACTATVFLFGERVGETDDIEGAG